MAGRGEIDGTAYGWTFHSAGDVVAAAAAMFSSVAVNSALRTARPRVPHY